MGVAEATPFPHFPKMEIIARRCSHRPLLRVLPAAELDLARSSIPMHFTPHHIADLANIFHRLDAEIGELADMHRPSLPE
jgi:hypothetical protein